MFSEEHVKSFLSADRVLHVYGSIGRDLSSPDNMERFFDPQVLHALEHLDIRTYLTSVIDAAYDCSRNLQTIDPSTKNNNAQIHLIARDLIKEASDIYVLGYGFDHNNSDTLGLGEHFRRLQADVKVYFTNFKDRNTVNKRAGLVFFQDESELLSTKPQISRRSRITCEKSTRDVYGALEMDFDIS